MRMEGKVTEEEEEESSGGPSPFGADQIAAVAAAAPDSVDPERQCSAQSAGPPAARMRQER